MLIIDIIIKVIKYIGNFLTYAYKYRDIFKITGIFATRKFKKTSKFHKYAVLIAARNEEAVIGNLIDSIRKQDYPSELVDIFVVADNCTDKTAEIARNFGAICYERFDDAHRTKGFALQFLVQRIKEDYGDVSVYDGYFLFDADNLLKSDYITRMNESFSAGEKIITSYRSSKNFDSNWIAASYSIHWLRTVRNEHRARSLFHLATRIQGTGFLFSWELIRNGWNYTSLTEDRAFCADAVEQGYKISYNNEAIFYDEQPLDMKIAMRQRIRWAKGHLQALVETGGKLFLHIFYTGGAANRDVPLNTTKFKRFINNIRLRFMSFDMLTVVFPNGLWSVFKKFVQYSLYAVLGIAFGKEYGIGFAADFLEKVLNLFGVTEIHISNAFEQYLWIAACALYWSAYSYVNGMLTAAYVFIIEHRRIIKMSWYKKVWYTITFPIFDFIGKLAMVIALFTKVEWKPIPHGEAVNIDDLKEENIA